MVTHRAPRRRVRREHLKVIQYTFGARPVGPVDLAALKGSKRCSYLEESEGVFGGEKITFRNT